MAIRAIAKVSESYKAERKHLHRFRKLSSVQYDPRILSFKGLASVSILTIEGRIRVPFVIGSYAKLNLSKVRGQADLVYFRGNFYLACVVTVPDGTPFTPKGTLGVDFGIANIAATSDGELFSGKEVNHIRQKATKFKRKLQRCGSKSAKRHLKKYSGKERRFKRHTNHVISKRIVSLALKTQRAIALEDLKGFRPTVRKAQREIFGKWAFDELKRFIEYKARLKGVPVVLIDPRYTSQTCSACGHVSKSNRKSQSLFSCASCGETLHADTNAARNIGRLAECKPATLNLSPSSLLNLVPPSGTESPGL